MRQTERARHGGRDKLWTRQGAQLGDEYAIGKPRREKPRHFQAQSRLAYPAGTDQADQPMFRGQGCDFPKFGLSTDQFRNRLRKVRHPRGWSASGRGRRYADLTSELIAVTGHCPDETTISAKRLSEHGDLGWQVVSLDGPVRPHAAHEFVFAEHRATSVDEGHERIKRPTAQLDRLAIGQQLSAMADDPEPAKFDCCRNFR